MLFSSSLQASNSNRDFKKRTLIMCQELSLIAGKLHNLCTIIILCFTDCESEVWSCLTLNVTSDPFWICPSCLFCCIWLPITCISFSFTWPCAPSKYELHSADRQSTAGQCGNHSAEPIHTPKDPQKCLYPGLPERLCDGSKRKTGRGGLTYGGGVADRAKVTFCRDLGSEMSRCQLLNRNICPQKARAVL